MQVTQRMSEQRQSVSESMAQRPQYAWNNPYLDLWLADNVDRARRAAALIGALQSRDRTRLQRCKSERVAYTHKYGYAVPTVEALVTVKQHAPLLEIGAGNGYWAWMLRQAQTDIVAYDLNPPTAVSDANRFHERVPCWTEVLGGDETVVDRWPDRTLFLCWPPANDPMAFRSLERYRGDTFIFVGEEPLNDRVNVTGNADFVRLLRDSWQVVQIVPLPNWELCWDRLYVFRRTRISAGVFGLGAGFSGGCAPASVSAHVDKSRSPVEERSVVRTPVQARSEPLRVADATATIRL